MKSPLSMTKKEMRSRKKSGKWNSNFETRTYSKRRSIVYNGTKPTMQKEKLLAKSFTVSKTCSLLLCILI